MTSDTVPATSTSEFVGEARVNPKTGRPAGPLQGVLLLIGSCLPVLGAVLLAPVLPTMTNDFASTPGAAGLVPLVLTAPALFIALLAPFAGRIIDKLGRKRVLVIALVIYAMVGTAPLWLDALPAILISRMLVGITEAFIITGCTTLIADYFTGGRRDRYLGLQAVVTALAATVFFAVGGALGTAGWRTPFWLYAVSIVVAIAVIVAIWPARQSSDGGELVLEQLPRLNWRPVIQSAIVTVFGGIVFYTLIVELPYLVTDLGVSSTAAIGVGTALASLATAIGAFTFRWGARFGPKVLLPIAFGIAGIGMLLVSVSSAVPALIAAAMLASLGTGLLLPTLITWAIARLTYEQRGRGAGIFSSAIFFGEFVCPIAVIGLTGAAHGLPGAIAIVGVLSLVMAAATLIILRAAGRTADVAAPASAA